MVLSRDHLLQMLVIFPHGVSKLGRSFLHQQLPLCPLIVLLAKYPGQLCEHFQLVLGQLAPRLAQSVHRV